MRDFVNQKLFPYLHGFKQRATDSRTIEYKVGEIFGELKNKITSGYNLREIIDHRREVRAGNARVYINMQFSAKQQVFLDFVLEHYVSVGVEELDQQKLTPLLRLRYNNSLADAFADLGEPSEIGAMFAGFQKYLYQP